MSIAHLHEEEESLTSVLSVDAAPVVGLIIRRRHHWTMTNIADEAVVVSGRNLPIGVGAPLRPFDIITIGPISYCFIPVLPGGGPNE